MASWSKEKRYSDPVFAVPAKVEEPKVVKVEEPKVVELKPAKVGVPMLAPAGVVSVSVGGEQFVVEKGEVWIPSAMIPRAIRAGFKVK